MTPETPACTYVFIDRPRLYGRRRQPADGEPARRPGSPAVAVDLAAGLLQFRHSEGRRPDDLPAPVLNLLHQVPRPREVVQSRVELELADERRIRPVGEQVVADPLVVEAPGTAHAGCEGLPSRPRRRRLRVEHAVAEPVVRGRPGELRNDILRLLAHLLEQLAVRL